MDAAWNGRSNASLQSEVGSGSLLSGLLSPSWPPLDSSLHMLPHASLTSSAHLSSTNSAGINIDEASGALRDPALASTLYGAIKSGSATPSHPLTPLQSSILSSYPGTFGRLNSDSADLYSRVGSASAMSAPLLDLLNPSAPSTFSTGGAHGLDLHGQQDLNNDEQDDDEDEEDEDDDGDRSIDLEQEERATQAHSSAATAEPERSDNDDEDYCPSEGDDAESGADDDASDDEGGLMSWVAESERNGADPKEVLRRLLSEYADVPMGNKLLWKTAYSLSARIQQHLTRQAARRVKLPHINSLDDVCALIQKSQRIVVLTGAGISVAAGIPDFRSRGGIYPRLKREFGLESPEAMFDLEYFRANPKLFYSFARELWPGAHHPTLAHRFIAMLEQKGKLLRNYTQNIDALESRAGIQNVLQCHGSFASARCMSCKRKYHGMHIHREIMAQSVPKCAHCHPPGVNVEALEEVGEDGLDRSCKTFGVIKPEITFFGENLPESFRTCLQSDRHQADLVIVMGSSLKVQPVAGMLELFSASTPMVLINREVVGDPDEFDVELCGLADEVCSFLADRLGWTLPELDPNRDTFRQIDDAESEKQTDGDQPDDAAAAAANARTEADGETAAAAASSQRSVDSAPAVGAATDPNLVLSPPAAALSPRAVAPLFVAPNRYLFAGACPSASPGADSSSSASSSAASDGSLSPQPIALTHAGQHRVMPPASPLAPPALPSLDFKPDTADLAAMMEVEVQSPKTAFSPKLQAARPAPLQLDHAQLAASAAPTPHDSSASPGDSAVAAMSLTCTPPVKSSRHLAHGHVHHSAAHAHDAAASPPANNNGAVGKRKAECAETGSVSNGLAADKLADGAAQTPAPAAITPVDKTAPVHLPPVKRRKVSVPESKEE